jgi:hypothetical protein
MSEMSAVKVCQCGATKTAHQAGGACGAFQYDGAKTFAAKGAK